MPEPTEEEILDLGERIIKHEGDEWVLYTADGKTVLGRHPTKAAALAQEQAIEIAKHKADAAPGAHSARPPRDQLVRAMSSGYEVREEGTGPELVGHFAVFNQWARIDSAYEGTFMERNVPGAFAKTISENGASMRILLNHGKDPQLGDKPIAGSAEMSEDATGAAYRAPLLDGVPDLVVAGLRAGVYGSSYRFQVVRDEWVDKPKRSDYNPDGIPERTIKEARVYEFGPVTFPAYAGATAGVRSMTDEYLLENLTEDPAHLRDLIAYIAPDAPSADAGETHLESERREEPVVDPPPPPPPIVAEPPKPKDPAPAGSSDSRDKHMNRDEMVARATELDTELRELAVAYPGVLPKEPQAQWDAKVAEKDQLERDVTAWDARQAYVTRQAEKPGSVEPAFSPPTVIRKLDNIYDLVEARTRGNGDPERTGQIFRDNAMRAVEGAVFPHPAVERHQDEAKTHVQKLLDFTDQPTEANPNHEIARRVLMTGSPIYRRAFMKSVGNKQLSNEERAVLLESGTGALALPFYLDPTIIPIGVYTAINPFRQACRVEQIVGTNAWQGITSTVVVATRVAENTVATDATPTLAQPAVITNRVQTLVTYSIELGQDRPDLVGEFARLINEAKDNEEEASFAVGNGAAPNCMGVLAIHTVGSYTVHTTDVANVLDVDDVDKFEAAVPIRYRMNAAWFMNRFVLRNIQGFEGVNGRLFGGNQYAKVGPIDTQPNGNTGLRLLGYPVYEVPSAPADVTTSSIIAAALIDPKTYVIVDRIGMTLETIPHVFNAGAPNVPYGQRGLYAMWRNGAAPLNLDGGRRLEVHA